MLGFFNSYHLPKIKSWLLIEVEKQSQKHSSFRVWPQSVELTFFPPGIEFQDVRVLPQNQLKQNFGPIHVERVEVNISFLGLVQGKIRASSVSASKPKLKFISKQSLAEVFAEYRKKPSNAEDFSLETLFRLPIDEIEIEGLDIQALFSNENLGFHMQNSSLHIENRFKSLLIRTDFSDIRIKQIGKKEDLTLSIESKLLLEEEGIQVSALKLKSNDSFVVASGKLDGNLNDFSLSQLNLNTRLFLQLQNISEFIRVFDSKANIPALEGTVGSDTQVSFDFKKENISGLYSVETKNIKVDNRLIGTVRSKGAFKEKSVQSPLILIQNHTGTVRVQDFQIEQKDKLSVKGKLDLQRLDIRPFLSSIGVGQIPVDSKLSGVLPCQGDLLPDLKIQCQGTAASKDLHIFGETKDDTIAKVGHIEAKGSLELTNTQVSYVADLNAGRKSQGSSKGTISFEKGFDISFIGTRVEMSDIDNLVGLKLEGAAVLSGETNGTSKWGQVEIDTRAKQMWLEDYGLGNVDSLIRYKDGKLTFRQMKGQFNSTRYQGGLTLDLRKKEIFLNQSLEFIDLNDVQTLFSRKLKLPVSVGGTGSGELQAWGPLHFNKMSYKLESNFYRGEIAKETFEKGTFNVSAKDGVMKSDAVVIEKASSSIRADGTIQPDGKIDMVIVGRRLRLEQSENLSRAGLDIVGQFDSTLLLKGQLPDPEIVLNGRLINLALGGSPAEDSSFRLNIMRDRLEGDVNFIGKTVQSQFVIPYTESGPFKLNLKTTNWDFTSLFSLLSSTAKKKDFKTQLTMDVALTADKGGFWNSTGQVDIPDFVVQRGPLKMSSTEPMSLSFKNGSIQSRGIQMRGDGSFLKVDFLNATHDAFVTDINGKIDMSLLALVTPFLDDLRGTLSLALKTRGPINNLEFLGSAFVQNGYVKLAQFPHPFDQIQADILFNQRNIVINALKTTLGGGLVKGEGRIRLDSMTEVPVDFRAQFDDISLNIPDGMRTKGSGDLQFSGNRFPYTLKGTYNVHYGDITMDFTGTPTQANEIKPSEFLPQFLTTDAFQPLRLDLQINLNKPVSVKNELLDLQAKGKVAVKGPPDNLRLDGVINPTPGGKIKFKDTDFEILTGYVDFRNSAPDRPIVYLSAEAKVAETTVNTTSRREEISNYEISMLVQGQAPNVDINMESRPPLSYQQIISLLALGMTTTTSIDSNYDPQAQSSDGSIASGVIGTQIGTRLIGRQLSEPLKERLGVEVKISTSLNTVDNATYPKVIFSKQWTPKVETSASRTIENNPKSDVKLEYKVNDSVSFIGLWEGREQNSDTNQEYEENKVGVDVEYKVNFK
jgi:translocation and assembly module TamB